jgi:3-dehydroquinate synthase
MKKIIVNLGTKYPIYIGNNLLASKQLIDHFSRLANRIVIIADKNVSDLYAKPILKQLHKNNITAHLITFIGGEKNKTRHKLSCGRDTCIIAVGGGVTTDIAGFIASTYCRGIPVVYVPTSLLAMVDASIGGKTGVDTLYGKNLVGTFYQPHAVFIDINTLSTLPAKEFKNGMVELIKHAFIKDAKLFGFLERNVEKITKQNKSLLESIIARSCEIKKQIVERDEKECGGIRLLSNFGHTVGHAIENVANYRISHGNAVALGIIAESFISLQLGLLLETDFAKILHIFKQYAIPTALHKNYSLAAIKAAMQLDKKSKIGTPYFVLLDKIGVPHFSKYGYAMPVPTKAINNSLKFLFNYRG